MLPEDASAEGNVPLKEGPVLGSAHCHSGGTEHFQLPGLRPYLCSDVVTAADLGIFFNFQNLTYENWTRIPVTRVCLEETQGMRGHQGVFANTGTDRSRPKQNMPSGRKIGKQHEPHPAIDLRTEQRQDVAPELHLLLIGGPKFSGQK